MKQDSDWLKRAADFERRLRATGLTRAQFQAHSGLTRNVLYNLSKGQPPSSQEKSDKLDRAFQTAGSKN